MKINASLLIISRSFLLVTFMILQSSCAMSYIDDDGNHRIIGLVNITLNRPVDSDLVAGDKVEIESIGVMYSKTALHHGLTVGYGRETTVVLKNDAITLLK